MEKTTTEQVLGPRFHGFCRSVALICLLICVVQHTFARVSCPPQGPRMSAEEYCRMYGAEAQQQMQQYGVPASITLAQGMLESAFGSSYLAVIACNHFGIKAYHGWNGPVERCDDDSKSEPFCKFSDVLEGYEFHSKFLKNNARYGSLFKLSRTDYKGWAKGLQKCGYATNPQYADQLISLIERYNLSQYDDPKYVAPKSKESKADSKKASKKSSKSDKQKKAKAQKSQTTTKSSVQLPENRHKLYITAERGGLKYVVFHTGDDLRALAWEFGVTERRVRSWNDFPDDYVVSDNEIVYIQRKHRKADRQHPTHTVVAGESLHSISQRYGVRVSSIMKRNNMTEAKVQVGQVLQLR